MNIRFPQDVYQTTKVSKILMAINRGDSFQFQGKSLNEIEVLENEVVDSENDSNNEYIPKIRLKRNINTPPSFTTIENSNGEINISGPF